MVENKETLKCWLLYAACTFVAIVSVVYYFRVQDIIWRVLLIVLAVISFILAIYRIWSSRKMANRIKKLEEEKQDKIVYASEDTCGSMVDELV